MWQLTLEAKILFFKTLAISKIVHPALVKDVPSNAIAQLVKIQKQLIWKNGSPKLKPSGKRSKRFLSSLPNVLSVVALGNLFDIMNT